LFALVDGGLRGVYRGFSLAQLADLARLGQPVATGMATTKDPDTASCHKTTSAPDAPRDRLPKASLVAALETFAALATAYADGSEADLAGDREAEETVRAIVEKLDGFARKRNAEAEPRVMLAVMNGLRDVYAHVRAVAEGKLTPKRVRYGTTWGTAEDRRTEIWKVIAPWIPDFTEDELAHVDLTADEIRQRQGSKLAAQSVVAFLFDKGSTSKSGEGRAQRGRMLRNWERKGIAPAGEEERENPAPKVFGSPLSIKKTMRFTIEALGASSASAQAIIDEHERVTRERRHEVAAELIAKLEPKP
jgi:hypothetical protein